VAATYMVRDGLRDYYGTSQDWKPRGGVPNGSSFTEMDTGVRFLFDEERRTWLRQPAAAGGASGGGSGGAADHRDLVGRDAADQHPMSAIAGLEDALTARLAADDLEEVTGQDVAELWGSLLPDTGGGAGTVNHRLLSGRDAPDQHPISAIEGLAEALAAKVEAGTVAEVIGESVQEMTEQDIRDIWDEVMPV